MIPRPARSRTIRRIAVSVVAGSVAGALCLTSVAQGGTSGDGPDVIQLPDGFGTEGVASVRGGGTFFATSLRGEGVYTGNLRDGTAESLVRLPGTSLRGAVVDPTTGYVWIAGSRDAQGIVLVINPEASDPVVEEVVLPRAGFPNDLTLVPRAAWVTDSMRDRLYRVRVAPDGSAGRVVTRHLRGDWDPVRDDPEGTFAANGIRRLQDGELLVVDSRDGRLVEVTKRTGKAVEVKVRGEKRLKSGDGLVRHHRKLYVVRGRDNDRVAVLRLHKRDGLWRANYRRSVGDPDLSVPSTATLDRGSLWAVNAEFGTGDETFEVVRIDLDRSTAAR